MKWLNNMPDDQNEDNAMTKVKLINERTYHMIICLLTYLGSCQNVVEKEDLNTERRFCVRRQFSSTLKFAF